MFLKDNSLYVGFFLALREIRRTNPWTTALIVFVMTLTFFNMNLVGGVLIGIAHGVVTSYKQYYSGDVLITPATSKNDIVDTDTIMSIVHSLSSYQAASVRYTAPALVEYGYQNKLRQTDLSESSEGLLTGIDPVQEERVTHLSKAVIAGSYLDESDVNQVLIGASLIKKYASLRGSVTNLGAKILKTPDVGSKIRITVNGIQREVFIKGIVSTDGTNIDNRIIMTDTAARELLGNTNLNGSEIAITLKPNASEENAKKYFEKNIPNDQDILIQTASDALPGGVSDIIKTFTILGNIVGGIALIVGAITIFIVIFVNAVTRRKYIGILKGIGISSRAIEISYILQALFYAVSGILIASALAMWLFVPYFIIHPIEFPVAKGSLAITTTDLAIRGIILTVTSFISGIIPAWLVTRQNTLDAILGR
ncbi:MAG TPA: ABC transporter permease [Candidatus Acidoferrales bacterium]|nr:ABC transporter permease [Candidatus Acidoferrales bacterium]